MRFLKFLILTLIYSSTFAQSNMEFEFDFAQFGYDSTKNYLEIYYSFRTDKLVPKIEDSAKIVSGQLLVQLFNKSSNDTLVNKLYNFDRDISDTSSAFVSNTLVGVVSYIIGQGEYILRVGGIDLNDSTSKKIITESLKVKPFHSSGMSVSDVQLATMIKNENINPKSIFYKNTLEVYPNPAMLYSFSTPVMYFYAELYNLDLDTSKQQLYLNKMLLDSKGRIKDLKKKKISRSKKPLVEVGLINLSKFPTDTYTFIMGISDTTKQSGIVSTKKFFLYNPDVIDSSFDSKKVSNYVSSEFGVMSDEECDLEFQIAMYIATSDEINHYDGIDSLNMKREFLYKFWQKRDPDKSTPQNELRIQYKNRYEYVNRRFTTIQRPGWKTDRGRVYLVYGEPDQMDLHPNETDKAPYEIWYYNSIEGGVIFVFADLTGFSDAELIHSTKRGELRDETWERRIYKN